MPRNTALPIFARVAFSLGLNWTISILGLFPSSMPPHLRRVTCSTACSHPLDADWRVQSDTVPNSRLQVQSTTESLAHRLNTGGNISDLSAFGNRTPQRAMSMVATKGRAGRGRKGGSVKNARPPAAGSSSWMGVQQRKTLFWTISHGCFSSVPPYTRTHAVRHT